MDKNLKKLNKSLISGWTVIAIILIAAYFIEFLKDQRSLDYMLVFYSVTVIPAAACGLYYRRHRDSNILRYLVLAGYFIMYTFVLMTSKSNIVFVYILPMLTLMLLYHEPKLVLVMGSVTTVDNIAFAAIQYSKGKINVENSNQYEIQFAVLLICFSFLYFASKLYDNIYKENNEYIRQLDDNHRQLQHVTLQTITTIANIIDAKDEYTKGHSYRVAEYSSALAREIGYDEERVQDIKYIGLLHDIGKIGVPDSILNKPGRLNDAEFGIMRSHSEIGSKILSGNRMIDGVDEGAAYHHERWDGKGYPKGLKGEEIPKIARIIGIADAYDAMTSNRVYRKRLSDEDVIAELKRCTGSQFDPEICPVFIKLLEEGKLKQLSPDQMRRRNEHDESLFEQSTALLKSVLEYRNTDDGSHDYLTGALSLKAGETRIAEELLSNDGGIFIADITKLRQTNEKFGLLAGDHILRTASDVLLNRPELITVRYSGDQFLCFASGIDNHERFGELLNSVCVDITTAISELPENTHNSAAIGGVLSSESGRDLPTLLIAADKALYHIKQTKKPGSYIFSRAEKKINEKNLSKIDLEKLIKGIEEDAYSGIYNVDYQEFTHIYNFIRSICMRNKQQMQLILITMSPVAEQSPTVTDRDEAMTLLEAVINRMLRKVDVMFRFSSSQCIILLNNTNKENIDLVANRVISSFYRQYDKKNMSLSYDAADIKNVGTDE